MRCTPLLQSLAASNSLDMIYMQCYLHATSRTTPRERLSKCFRQLRFKDYSTVYGHRSKLLQITAMFATTAYLGCLAPARPLKVKINAVNEKGKLIIRRVALATPNEKCFCYM